MKYFECPCTNRLFRFRPSWISVSRHAATPETTPRTFPLAGDDLAGLDTGFTVGVQLETPCGPQAP